MPIIRMINSHEPIPDGAYCPLEWKANQVVVVEDYNGLCIAERERNMHDDSDFYMTVYNPETNKFEEIMFATTRGWSYPCLASRVDAPKELIEKYNSYLIEQDRIFREACRVRLEEDNKKKASECNISIEQLEKLRAAYPNHQDFHVIYQLLKTKKFRSKFRASLAAQVREWLLAEQNVFRKPLSQKQFFLV